MIEGNNQYQSIIKMSFGYFGDKLCTFESLGDFLRLMDPMLKAAGVTWEEAYSDLERRHTVTLLDSASILEDKGDHLEWYNTSISNGLYRSIDWHFWTHFADYLTSAKSWPKGIVEGIDRETNSILARLEDPLRSGQWDRRGMVVGSVQSGKTANYTGLICKAIDSGYKVIVVLAGVHNSLRSQTQHRLNEELLGYDLGTVQKFSNHASRIGVRRMFSDHGIVQTLTSSSEDGDFRRPIADQAGIIPSTSGHPTILVIKKHVSILRNLIEWATAIIGHPDDAGNRIVTDVPLLVIDDECDYASVNSKKVELDENGKVDPECDPAETNLQIRRLLNSFAKSVYVGYTATPFANVFIHHDHHHPRFGEDLFPRNFIISLPQPTNYLGPERIFGLDKRLQTDASVSEPLNLVRHVTDSEQQIPGRHKKHLNVESLPGSLEDAVRAFLISCAVRRLRNSTPYHNSMLVHVTRFTDVQFKVHTLVERKLREFADRIRSGTDELSDFHALWENDFQKVSSSMSVEFAAKVHEWKDVLDNLYPVVRRIRVCLINGTSADILGYRQADNTTRARIEQGEHVPWEERGEHVIAIGGDKLSRGLTLDGLTVSYYLRAAKMYDTLMQMGRWFGYRDGYTDLCRIYTTEELSRWYKIIAAASRELHQELDYMALINAEPKQFGLKVLDSPGQLAITSVGKRRHAESLKLSFSGRISETVVFDLRQSGNNLAALDNLISAAGVAGEAVPLKQDTYRTHWKNVPPHVVTSYLRSYKTHSEAVRVVDPNKMALFIDEQQRHRKDDLTTWEVVVLSRLDKAPHSFVSNGMTFGCYIRKATSCQDFRLTIGRLVNPSDEWIDFSLDEKQRIQTEFQALRREAGKDTGEDDALPPGPLIRALRPKQRGLLLVYPICSGSAADVTIKYGMEHGCEVTGFAISFPSSNTTHQVDYRVNSVYQELEV